VPAPRKPCPFATAAEIEAALVQAGGVKPLARRVGGHQHTLEKWCAELGANRRAAAGPPPVAPVFDTDDGSWLLAHLERLGDAATIEELADAADVPPRRVRDAAARLAERGYRIGGEDARVVLERVPPAPAGQIVPLPETALFAGEKVRLGVVSDTHIASREHRNRELQTAYHVLADEGVTTVLHLGDLVAGRGIYRHQDRDLVAHTFETQVDLAVELYPRLPGVRTLMISGNHDLEGEFGRMGADPVRAFAARRDDVEYLGEYDAWLELPNGAHIHMLHPGGGASYALSYRPQKLCESYEQGRKPAALLLGHYHRRGDFEHRAIQTLLCGTFEGSTALAKRLGLGQPAIGFHSIEATIADDGSLVDWWPRWRKFHTGRRLEAA
jgi:predicted phosphodiesterase